jgi:hypothetical protein
MLYWSVRKLNIKNKRLRNFKYVFTQPFLIKFLLWTNPIKSLYGYVNQCFLLVLTKLVHNVFAKCYHSSTEHLSEG